MSHATRSAERAVRQHFRIGLLAVLLSLIALYLAFAGLPFQGGYKVSAIVSSANALRPNAPVRIAGVNVGKVTGIARGPGHTARITMRIDDRGLPLHRDATLKIRPRLFLEGNFFVDLKPGTPSAPTLGSGGTIPLTQTAIPVQFDEVLTALRADSRKDLQRVLHEYATALGKGGAQAINRAYKPSEGAFKGVALVSRAARGLTEDDLRRFIADQAKVSGTLAAHREQLADLLTSFRRTVGALAAEPGAVSASTRQLASLVRESYPALGDINASLPPLRELARESRPLVRRAPHTLDLAQPLLDQLNRLVSPAELPPLLTDLKPTLGALAAVEPKLVDLLDKVTPVSECVRDNALPTLTSSVDDGPLSTHRPVWQEFLATMPGLASAAQNFDGNGPAVRYQAGGDQDTVSVGKLPGAGTLFGAPQNPLLGSRPAKPSTKPPFHPEVPCSTQAKPDLQARTTAPAAQRAVRTQPFSKADARSLVDALISVAAKQRSTGRLLGGRSLRSALDKARAKAEGGR